MDYKKYLVLICLSFGLYAGQSFDTLNLTRSGHAVHGWWGRLHDTADVADTCLHSPAAVGGNGTQYYAPLWLAGGRTLGNSLYSQNSAGTYAAIGQSGIPAARFEICSPSGAAHSGLQITQLAENVTNYNSYIPIDFSVPTTGLVGQFFATANNYYPLGINLSPNCIGLMTETTNGQLSLGSCGTGGYVTVTAGGFPKSSEIARFTSAGLCVGDTIVKTPLTVGQVHGSQGLPTLGAAGSGIAGFYSTQNALTTPSYGLMIGDLSSGDAWLQSQRVDGTATAYNLLLQPVGGKVEIGPSTPDSTLTDSGSFHVKGNTLLDGKLQLSNYTTNGVAKFTGGTGLIGASTNIDSGAVTVGAIPVGVTNTHTLTASNGLTESGTTLTVADSLNMSTHGGYFPYGVTVGISAPLTINANSAAHQWTMQTGGATYGYGLNIFCTNAANHQILFDTIGGIHAFNLTANDTLYGKDANISDSLYVNSALLTTITAAPYGGYYGGICGSGSTLLTGSSTGGTVIGSGGTGNIYITDAYSTAPALTVRTDSTLFAEPIAGYAGGNLNFAVNGASSINFRYGANLLLSLGYGGTGITFSQLAPASGVSLLTVSTSGLIAAMPHDSIYMGQGIRTAQSFWGVNATLSGTLTQSSGASTLDSLNVHGTVVQKNGYGGFGTTNPLDRLYIAGTTATSPGQIAFGDGGVYSPYMHMYKWTGGGSNYLQTTVASSVNAAGGGIEFMTGPADGGAGAAIGSDIQTTRMTILRGTGNVGRGTLTPVSPLTNIGQFTDTGSIDLTNSIAFDSAQTVTAITDQNLTPIRTLIELNGTYNFALQAGSLKNGTVILITRGSGSGGYPNVTYNGHSYAIDANHSFWFVKNSAGTWYPLTPYTS